VATIGSHVDLMPTLAHLLELPPAPSWEGRSLFEAGRPPRAYFYAANDDYLLGVREANWKYIYNVTRGRDELYDLARDPREQHNLAEQHPQACQRLRRHLAAWRSYVKAQLDRLRPRSG
jgi:arylsulfatase A-like enzyme